MSDQLTFLTRNRQSVATMAAAAAMAIILIIAGCSSDEDVVPTGGDNGNSLPDTVFYADVQTIFGTAASAGNCALSSCHDATAPEQGLNMTTYNTILAGSNSGAVVIPDSSSQSELYKRITGVSTPQMPLGGSLSAAQIELIGKWIDDGALE